MYYHAVVHLHNFRLVSNALGFGSFTITSFNVSRNVSITFRASQIWMVWAATHSSCLFNTIDESGVRVLNLVNDGCSK
jgi:hypothetical protein